jgi:hypothetical protein
MEEFNGFIEALCERDGGRPRGVPICMPMVIGDARTQTSATRQLQPDAKRQLSALKQRHPRRRGSLDAIMRKLAGPSAECD